MAGLIDKTADAVEWVRKAQAELSSNDIFGVTRPGVIWAEATEPDGGVLVAMNPESVVDDVNKNGFSLLKGHDPGFPVGKVLAAALFTSPAGTKFIAAILGFYQGSKPCGFNDLGLSPELPLPDPQLPILTDAAWMEFSVDPREVPAAWVAEALADAPLRVEKKELSHNAADAIAELIRIGLPYAVLVWNPFVKAILTEAGVFYFARPHPEEQSCCSRKAFPDIATSSRACA